MEELLNKKTELEKRITDLQSEIEMGTILEDQEMINQANASIEEINKLISEIDQKIELEGTKASKKKELEEKYPEQYLYERIMTMSEEELNEYSGSQIAKNKEEKSAIEKNLEELAKKGEVLSAELSLTVTKIAEVKEKFKNTHDPALLTEAKELVDKQAAIKQEIEQNEAERESTNQKLTEIGPTEMSPEEVRKGMIAQLEGKYKESSESATLEFIQQAEGKSLEEVTKAINEETKNNSKNKIYKDILEKNSEQLPENSELYAKIEALIESCTTAINELKDNNNVKQICEDMVESLTSIKERMDIKNSLLQKTGEINQKIARREITLTDGEDEKEVIYKDVDKQTKEIQKALVRARTLQRMLNTVIVYEMSDQLDDEHKIDDSKKERDIEIVKLEKDNYPAWVQVMTSGNEDKDDPKIKNIIDVHEKVHQEAWRIIKQAEKLLEHISTNEKNNETGKKIAAELSGITASAPGQYTVEDINKYLIEQEFLQETKETAKKDSESKRAELTNKNENVEINKLPEEELAKMFEETPSTIEEEKQTGITY